jgi:tetratricopeptide (TPR) repeat protein
MVPDAHLQRAELLADLGRYDDAAEELAHAIATDPQDVDALALLARVRLAAGDAKGALEPANRAVAAGPGSLPALAVRGHVLVELDHPSAAASMADELLRLGPDDAFAQISAAAILSESRNGQVALNAAWHGVRLAPEQATAHLVLGAVAARLRLFDLAEQAYREALRLDPELSAAQHNIGLIRFEQRRFAEGLSHLREVAAANPSDMDSARSMRYGFYQVLWTGAGYAMIAPITAAAVGASGQGIGWRLLALALGAIGIAGIAVFARRLPGRVSEVLPGMLRGDRMLTAAALGVAIAPPLLLVYALVGTPWPLVLAIVGGFVTLFAAVRHTYS